MSFLLLTPTVTACGFFSFFEPAIPGGYHKGETVFFKGPFYGCTSSSSFSFKLAPCSLTLDNE